MHLLQVDERMLGQSLRADPELLAIVDDRFSTALRPPCLIKVVSDSGTELEVRLALTHPILSSTGCPAQGASENLPAGLVYTHPGRVSGTLIVDGAIFGPTLSINRAALRRAPVRARFNGGRLTDFETADPTVARAIDAYLASHVEAARSGFSSFPPTTSLAPTSG